MKRVERVVRARWIKRIEDYAVFKDRACYQGCCDEQDLHCGLG